MKGWGGSTPEEYKVKYSRQAELHSPDTHSVYKLYFCSFLTMVGWLTFKAFAIFVVLVYFFRASFSTRISVSTMISWRDRYPTPMNGAASWDVFILSGRCSGRMISSSTVNISLSTMFESWRTFARPWIAKQKVHCFRCQFLLPVYCLLNFRSYLIKGSKGLSVFPLMAVWKYEWRIAGKRGLL